MKKNMGNFDRILRSLAAGILVWLCYAGIFNGLTEIILLIIAGILFLTSIFGVCPLYSLLGVHTCKMEQDRKNVTHG